MDSQVYALCFHLIVWASVSSAGARIDIEAVPSEKVGDDFIFHSHDNWQLTCHSSTSPPERWTYPSLPQEFGVIEDRIHRGELQQRSAIEDNASSLTIKVLDSRHRDTGYYTCHLQDKTSKSVYVYVSDDSNLILNPSADAAVPLRVNKSAASLIPCRPTHPKDVTLRLKHCVPSNVTTTYIEKCGSGRKLEEIAANAFTFDPRQGFTVDWTKISFDSAENDEVMQLFCIAQSGVMSELTFEVTFIEEPLSFRPPQIEGQYSRYVAVGEGIILNCSTENYTSSSIKINWILPQPDAKDQRIKARQGRPTERLCNKAQCKSHVSTLQITSAQLNDSGTYRCVASDNGRSQEATFNVTVIEGHIIYANISADQREFGVFLHQNVTLVANVQALLAPRFEWYSLKRNSTLLKPVQTKLVMNENATAAWLLINNIAASDLGTYQLKSIVKNQTQTLNFTLILLDKPAVHLKNIATKENEFSFSCNVTSYPPAQSISLVFSECPSSNECHNETRTFNHAIAVPSNSSIPFTKLPANWSNGVGYSLTRRNRNLILVVKGLRQMTGDYSCEASNELGSTSTDESFTVALDEEDPTKPGIIAVIVIIVIILIALLIVLAVKIRKERKRKELFRIHQLDIFRKGDPGSINPDLPVDEQTELLPYDRKWEFPRERLKLGVQLGAGAFGRVLKGEAIRIGAEPVTTVAVKMVRAQGNMMALKALMSELKIMIHLGSHLNVVNLLGACTKRVTRGELFVIVEYCRFGNLQNYLIRHRDRFVNLLQPAGTRNSSQSMEPSASSKNATARNAYAVLLDAPPQSDGRAGRVSFHEASDGTAKLTSNLRSDMSETDSSGVFVTSSNGQSTAGWRTNYRGDYRDQPTQSVSTQDLICWAFQISRGMGYLAKRRVLHGDLAARNVLLADDNVVKVADFGLAREVYRSENYKKKGEGPLPVKWMAIESIADRIFSTQSDVWSFGIVMWELFSLGKTPYPGLEADEHFYRKLEGGYRMEQPRYAPDAMYSLMMDCWKLKPSERPSFDQLEQSLGAHVDEAVRRHYVDLNDSYIQANCPVVGEDKFDYLELMADVGTKDQPEQPHYVNMQSHHVAADGVHEDFQQPDYLRMESKSDDEHLETSGYLEMSRACNALQVTSSKCIERDSGCPNQQEEVDPGEHSTVKENIP